MFSQKKFSERLRKLRSDRHMIQAQVAEAIGATVAMVSDMENGRRTTTIDKLFLLADFFNVSLDYLVGRSDDPAPPK